MSRFYFRLTLIPIALFTAVLIVIHAQPYDDHELRELLLPEGCPAPCFMGIRPGVTTVDKAIEMIGSNPLIGETRFYSDVEGKRIVFKWKDNSSEYLDNRDWVTLLSNNKMITYVFLPTKITVAKIWILQGEPDWGYGDIDYFRFGYANSLIAARFSYHLRNLSDLLNANITLIYQSLKPTFEGGKHPSIRDIISRHIYFIGG